MTSGRRITVRTVQRLRRLSEAECYARCYGRRYEESVRVVHVRPCPPRYETVSEELLRLLFEEKVDARAPEAA